MSGYFRSVGFFGIQPYFSPAWYDQSSEAVFQVHMTHPWAFSYVITCASQNIRNFVLYGWLNVDALPDSPSQLPVRDALFHVPSYSEPFPHPLMPLAQSVITGDHSPTVNHKSYEVRFVDM